MLLNRSGAAPRLLGTLRRLEGHGRGVCWSKARRVVGVSVSVFIVMEKGRWRRGMGWEGQVARAVS